ncbi:MAG: hypothetical protein HYV63_00275 [Candidatus Schekmanbacteria bacterium]|nr:hypothetical protein [Candidatus Schekmanbacteria bacterium]
MYRRDFLRISSLAGLAVAATGGALAGAPLFFVNCPACGCRSSASPLAALLEDALRYCRNCGALIATGEIDVESPQMCAGADCFQVPFPDHRYLAGSDKLLLSLKSIEY